MGPFDSLQISASALTAERRRSEIVAANMANVNTTRTSTGGPYKRQEVVFSANQASAFQMQFASMNNLPHAAGREAGTVSLSEIVDDPSAPIMRYEPGHPDANKDGFVAYPNINPVEEMVDMMGSVRAYQMNASAVAASKQIIQQSIDILKS